MKTALQQLIEKKGITQRELAKQCKISFPYMSDIVSRERTCSIEVQKRIADVLGVSVNAIWKDTIIFKDYKEEIKYLEDTLELMNYKDPEFEKNVRRLNILRTKQAAPLTRTFLRGEEVHLPYKNGMMI